MSNLQPEMFKNWFLQGGKHEEESLNTLWEKLLVVIHFKHIISCHKNAITE